MIYCPNPIQICGQQHLLHRGLSDYDFTQGSQADGKVLHIMRIIMILNNFVEALLSEGDVYGA